MKFKFKYVSMLVMAAMMAGFTACSDKDAVVDGENNVVDGELELREDDLTIQITVPETQGTRANSESETNVGIAPYTFDMTLVFVGKTDKDSPLQILRVVEGDVSALTGAGQKFKNMPLGVTGLYVIGNTDPTKYDMTVVNANPRGTTTSANFGKLAYKNTKTSLAAYAPKETSVGSGKYIYTEVTEFMKDVRISLDNYNLTDAKAVNISGYAPVTATQGTTPVRVVVTPAISRYEIKEVKSKKAGVNFDLKGIYISNTMREISVDGQQYPAATESGILLNWGWNNPGWNYTMWKWAYTQTYASGAATDALTDKDKLGNFIKVDFNNRFVAGDISAVGTAGTAAASTYYNYATASRNANHDYDNNVWNNWFDRTKAVGTGKDAYAAPDNKYWSFYIASARKQDDPNASPITNPYLDEGAYNRVGLECGYWAYRDEESFVNAGGTLVKNSMAIAGYNTEMGIPTWAVRGQGIQYGTFPTINIHVRLASPNSIGLQEGWLTVTKFYDANTKAVLQFPKPGTVYIIKSIAFDADKDLNPDPMWPDEETEISVEVIVEGWVPQETEVEF
ncbi:hypothetical protein [Bacteroides sp. 224]|uniref:hypothetical protein n=1 Tax=Bacteroides sp. 224 TaxID=2302936 RepID=UPI0013D49D5D|nr:hypothetical protein [Bacteroides sp. 224]NDV67139.1 hypothetical protein [Bacteroides sp. 224]